MKLKLLSQRSDPCPLNQEEGSPWLTKKQQGRDLFLTKAISRVLDQINLAKIQKLKKLKIQPAN